MEINKITVIGAGTMGHGIAGQAALSGFHVVLNDVDDSRTHAGLAAIRKVWAQGVAKGKVAPEAVAAAEARLFATADLEQAVGDADLVIEAVPEIMELKRAIFGRAHRAAPAGALLASNTSSLSLTEIAGATGRPAQVIGMHFFNPVAVMKLVEVIKGVQTSEATTATTLELAKALNKTPIPANDRAGFVSNRVLMPMINEAFYAWMEGVAEPAHIDEIMKLGCNFPMGPLRLADFIGLDTCEHIMNVLADGLNNDRYRACPLLKQLVIAGRLGDKSGRGVFDYTAAAAPAPTKA